MLPNNIEAEQAVLGALLLEQEQIAIVVDILTPDHFYKEAHRIIFAAIRDMSFNNRDVSEVDIVTVTEHLDSRGLIEKVGGSSYITTLIESVPTPQYAESYARIVESKFLQRQLIKAAADITTWGYNNDEDVSDLLGKSEDRIFNIRNNRATNDVIPIKDAAKSAFKSIEIAFSNKGKPIGITSGYSSIDRLINGFKPADLVILAARPGVGKTSLALNILQNVAINDGKAGAIFSLEMPAEQLVMRMMCSLARVEFGSLQKGFLKKEDWSNLVNATEKLARAPIFIVDAPGITPVELRAKSRRMKMEHDIQFLAIDYLQLIQVSGRRPDNRVQEVSEITRQMKILARELKVPILCLAQLSRAVEQRKEKRPQLADLRESGSIEQDADIVMFIYREQYNKEQEGVVNYDEEQPETEEAKIIIAKHRNGPTGEAKLAFQRSFSRFDDYDYSSHAE